MQIGVTVKWFYLETQNILPRNLQKTITFSETSYSRRRLRIDTFHLEFFYNDFNLVWNINELRQMLMRYLHKHAKAFTSEIFYTRLIHIQILFLRIGRDHRSPFL